MKRKVETMVSVVRLLKTDVYYKKCIQPFTNCERRLVSRSETRTFLATKV